MISKYPWLQNMQIKDRLQNSAYRIDEPEGCSWGDYADYWGHPCWCPQAGSGRIDALYCLVPRLHVRCPRSAGYSSLPPKAETTVFEALRKTRKVAIYDLLGRRIRSFSLPDMPLTRASILSYVESLEPLPGGAKIVRLETEEKVYTWRLVP